MKYTKRKITLAIAVILLTAIIPAMAQRTDLQRQTCEQMMGNTSGMMNYSRRMMGGDRSGSGSSDYHSTNSEIADALNIGPIGWFNIPF